MMGEHTLQNGSCRLEQHFKNADGPTPAALSNLMKLVKTRSERVSLRAYSAPLMQQMLLSASSVIRRVSTHAQTFIRHNSMTRRLTKVTGLWISDQGSGQSISINVRTLLMT